MHSNYERGAGRFAFGDTSFKVFRMAARAVRAGPRNLQARPLNKKEMTEMLLEGKNIMIYGGGGKAGGAGRDRGADEGPFVAGSGDDAGRRGQRDGLSGLGSGLRDDRNRLQPDQRHGR